MTCIIYKDNIIIVTCFKYFHNNNCTYHVLPYYHGNIYDSNMIIVLYQYQILLLLFCWLFIALLNPSMKDPLKGHQKALETPMTCSSYLVTLKKCYTQINK